MYVDYRPATPNDMPHVAALLEEYMQQTYRGSWHGTVQCLLRDGSGTRFSVTLAVASNTLAGFAAWRATYDLHYCVAGIEVIDMFVRGAHRGRGVAACLLAQVAALAAESGATFMTGGAVDARSGRLYSRSTVSHGNQPYLSGRAFRAFAALAGVSPRQLLEQLPPSEWNSQP